MGLKMVTNRNKKNVIEVPQSSKSLSQTDYKSLNDRALQCLEMVLDKLGLLQDGKQVGEQFLALNPLRNDDELGSFTIHMPTGKWSDFAIGDAGGDIVSLVAYLNGYPQHQAYQYLVAVLEEHSVPTTVVVANTEFSECAAQPIKELEDRLCMPVPADAPSMPESFGGIGKPTAGWVYRSREGDVLLHQLRFSNPGGNGKTYRPCTCWHTKTGYQWRFGAVPQPRPLYNLDELTKRPKAKVIVVEGEKSAEAAAKLFPDYVATTCFGGANGVLKTDLTDLYGREILIWPDNDEAGRKYAEELIKRLHLVAPTTVISVMKILDIRPVLHDGKTSFELGFETPEKWDAADALAMGWTADLIASLGKEYYETFFPPRKEYAPEGFRVDDKGVWVWKQRKDDNGIWQRVCSRIDVAALTRSKESSDWGLLLHIVDLDGKVHEVVLPKDMLSGSGDLYRQMLLNYGAVIASQPQTKEALTEYLMSSNPPDRVLCVTATGWSGENFVLPHKSYGPTNERVFFQSTNFSKVSPVATSGDKAEWDSHIGIKCLGNSRLMLAICISLAGPFLKHLEEENGGFHFRGESSTGKTKALTVAGSVWGGNGMIKSWRGTSNGLEGLALQFNDLILILDEMGQVRPADAGDIAYTLGNGQQKVRADRYGKARDTKEWRFFYLSSGEISLAQHMAQDKQQIRAGQEVRLLDIPANAGRGLGIFENIHGAENAANFADQLQEACGQYYGTLGDSLLKFITANNSRIQEAIEQIRATQKEFTSEAISVTSHGQVHRAAAKFGLVAGIGEYCIRNGLLPWGERGAFQAARTCFDAWMLERGGDVASEQLRALNQVKEIIQRYGESKFQLANCPGLSGERISDRYGFRTQDNNDGTEYWIFPEVYNSVLCNGFDQREVTKALIERNFLILDSGGKSSVSKKFSDMNKPMRLYGIKGDIIN